MRRRDLLQTMGLGMFAAGLPGLSFAASGGPQRFVLIILRGAVDGLAMVAPYGDANYKALRGELALAPPGSDDGLLKLDGMFGLHPSMPLVHGLYQKNQVLAVHAVASPYRERSHFDGQDALESGVAGSAQHRDGWLNRALTPLGGDLGREAAIALAQTSPLVLRGSNSVSSWAPSQLPDTGEDTLRRIADLYSNDAFFSTRFQQALEAQKTAAGMDGMQAKVKRNERAQFNALTQAAGRFLRAPDGPRIAVIESGGWDTHANQGAASGSLANKFSVLDEGIAQLREQLGEAWDNTIVALVTEFGRTVKVNGTRGTDHGTATAALLLGGAVNGGKVKTDWPGLADKNLYEGRDLYPTTDIRSVFKGVLTEHLHLAEGYVERVVFPDSTAAPAVADIVRT